MGADLYTCQQLHRESSSQGGAEKQEGGCLQVEAKVDSLYHRNTSSFMKDKFM